MRRADEMSLEIGDVERKENLRREAVERKEAEQPEHLHEVTRKQQYFEVMNGIQHNSLTRLNLGNVYGLAYDVAGLTLTGHSSTVHALTVLPDGCIVSGSNDTTIKLWRATGGSYACAQTLTGHSGDVYVLTVLSDGCIVSGNQDNTIKIWRAAGGSYACVQTLTGHSNLVWALTVLPDGCIVSGSFDKTIKLWRATGGSYTCVQTLTGHLNYVRALTVLPDGCIASGSDDKTIKLWRATGGSYTCVQTLTGHSNNVNALTVLPDGCIVSGSVDNTIKLWKATGGSYTCIQTLTGHSSSVSGLTILPDGSIISGSEDDTIKVWRETGGSYTCVQTLTGHSNPLRALAVLPDGSIVSGSEDKTIKVWNSSSRPCNEQEHIELLQALQRNTSIQALALPKTVSKQLTAGFCQCIAKSPSIAAVDLRQSTISNADLTLALQAISGNHSVKELSMPDVDLAAMSEIIPELCKLITTGRLVKMDLSNVRLNSESIDLLVVAVRDNRTLQMFSLPRGTTHVKLAALNSYLRRNGSTQQLAIPAIASSSAPPSAYQDMLMQCRCPLTKKIFLEPMVTLAGHSYEREPIEDRLATSSVDPTTKTELASRQLIPNVALQQNIKELIAQDPHFWITHGDELYYSSRLQSELVAAVLAGLTDQVAQILDLDQRLLTKELTVTQPRLTAACAVFRIKEMSAPSPQNLLQLACQQINPATLQSVLIRLDHRFWDCLGDDGGVLLFRLAASHMGIEGGRLLAFGKLSEATVDPCLGWSSVEVQRQLDGYIGEDNAALAKVCFQLLGSCVIKDREENTALHIAARDNKPNVLKLLLAEKVDLTMKNSDGNTALHLAAISGHKPTIELIMLVDLNTWIKNKSRENPQEAAVAADKSEIATFIDEFKARLLSSTPPPVAMPVTPISPTTPTPPTSTPAATRLASGLNVIPFDGIVMGKYIGEGGFGLVYTGTWMHEDVAVKKLRLTMMSDKAQKELVEEASTMAQLNHGNIVALRGICLESGKYSLVMELMPEGSLYNLLHSDCEISWRVKVSISRDIAAGLSYLHSRGIIHRDLKSLNVLLQGDVRDVLRAKLSDFGLSSLKTETRTITAAAAAPRGTVAWMAPELFARRARHTEQTDMYSCGMVYWEIASRKNPFSDAASQAVMIQWIEKGETEEIPEECPSQYKTAITWCWKRNPTERPPASKVVLELEACKAGLPEEAAGAACASGPMFASKFR